MTGFYIKCNTGLKWVNPFQYSFKKETRAQVFSSEFCYTLFMKEHLFYRTPPSGCFCMLTTFISTSGIFSNFQEQSFENVWKIPKG